MSRRWDPKGIYHRWNKGKKWTPYDVLNEAIEKRLLPKPEPPRDRKDWEEKKRLARKLVKGLRITNAEEADDWQLVLKLAVAILEPMCTHLYGNEVAGETYKLQVP